MNRCEEFSFSSKSKIIEPSSEGFQDFSGSVPPGYNWLDLNQNAEKRS